MNNWINKDLEKLLLIASFPMTMILTDYYHINSTIKLLLFILTSCMITFLNVYSIYTFVFVISEWIMIGMLIICISFLHILSIFSLISLLVTYFIFHDYFTGKQRKKELLSMQSYIDSQYNYYANMEKNQYRVRRMYHDMKNHLITIRNLDTAINSEVKIYIDTLLQMIHDAEIYHDTGNKIADIVLNTKFKKAEEEGISMEVVIEKGCLNHIHMIDISTIFSNALDNAIEAYRNQTQNKQIKVKAFTMPLGTCITFENNIIHTPNIQKNLLATTKKDNIYHGMGISSIKTSVKQYNGDVMIDITKDKFLMTVIIPMDVDVQTSS